MEEPREKNRNSRQVYVELRDELIEEIKAIAYWERKRIKDVVSEAVEKFVALYGEIKPIPKEKEQILDLSKIKKK